jgi:hypothetical protein
VKRALVVLVLCAGGCHSAGTSDSDAARASASATDDSAQLERDRALYRGLARDPAALPPEATAFALTLDLQRWLGVRDPELRDKLAFEIPARWIWRGMLSEDEMRRMLATWEQNLERGVGEKGGDAVLLRSFSALSLAALARRDAREPFLTPDERRTLLADALAYLERERDLRDYDAEIGWIHATAHTADLLRFIAMNPATTTDDARAILAAIERKLASVDRVFTHGESRRLAEAVIELAQLPEFDVHALHAWSERHSDRHDALWKSERLDERQYVIVENERLFFDALCAYFVVKEDQIQTPGMRTSLIRALGWITKP